MVAEASSGKSGSQAANTKPIHEQSNRSLFLALLGIILSLLLASLDQTIVGTAMPRIVEELQGFSLYSWVTTIYLLTSTAIIPIAGKLGDMFGRKWVLLTAVVIFLLGSMLCGAAPSMLWLVIFRGLQGIGGGALMSNAFASVSDIFPDPAKRARWQGVIAAAFGISSVLGPFLGGFITDNLNWRWVFYVNMPVGALAIAAIIFTLPYLRGTGSSRIDWFGAATITGAVVSLLLALSWGGQQEPNGYPWLSPQIIGLLAAAIVLTVLFGFIESKAAEPILPLHLFKIRMISILSVLSFVLGIVMLGTLLFIPLFVQIVMGQSATGSGAITTPLSLAMVFANIMTGQFIARVGRLKVPIVLGSIVMTVGVALLLTLSVSTAFWEVVIFMLVIGVGLGAIMPTLTISVQEVVPRQQMGVGTSTIQFFRSIGSTLGTGLIGTIVTNSYVDNIRNTQGFSNLPARAQGILEQPQNLINPQVAAALPPTFVQSARQALVTATHHGFLITVVMAGLALLVALVVPNIKVRSVSRQQLKAATNAVEGAEIAPEETATSPDGRAEPEPARLNTVRRGQPELKASIIAINYKVGSRGTEIGRAVAEKLGFEYVDRKIIQQVAQQLSISEDEATNLEENAQQIAPRVMALIGSAYPLELPPAPRTGPSPSEAIRYHQATRQIIEDIARQTNGKGVVIAGYRANFVLEGWPNLLTVFLHAPMEDRVRHIMSQQKCNDQEARRYIEGRDAERSSYVKQAFERRWDDPDNYHLALDTSVLGQASAIDIIAEAARTGSFNRNSERAIRRAS
jgi:EmrB/QacA subfamily drug resistance transporter